MFIARVVSGAASLLAEHQDIVLQTEDGDFKISYAGILLWSPEELAEHDLVPIADPEPPSPGYRSVGTRLELVGDVWTMYNNVVPIETVTLQTEKVDAVSQEFAARVAVPIDFTVADGGEKSWDADDEAVTNISGIVLLILCGASIPSPRPWTAHNELVPTNVTHAELIGLGGAIATRKDALFAIKKMKQGEIMDLTDPLDIVAYDPSAGWP